MDKKETYVQIHGWELDLWARADGDGQLVPFFRHGLDIGEKVGLWGRDRACGTRTGAVHKRHDYTAEMVSICRFATM
jgi:hypothetical protein